MSQQPLELQIVKSTNIASAVLVPPHVWAVCCRQVLNDPWISVHRHKFRVCSTRVSFLSHLPCRVVICGGGIIGAATAYYLAQQGVGATVIEREAVAAAASGKAGGFLALDWNDSSPVGPLARWVVMFERHGCYHVYGMQATPLMACSWVESKQQTQC